jgi:hypothetical protein
MPSQPVVLQIDKIRTYAGTTIDFDSAQPSRATVPGEVLTFDGSNFTFDSSFALDSDLVAGLATKSPIPVVTGANDVLKWDGSSYYIDSTFAKTAYVNTEVANLKTYVDGEVSSLIDNATTHDTIGKLETEVATKAPLPATPTGAGEALQWDGTTSSFKNENILSILGVQLSGHVCQVVSNTETGGQTFVNTYGSDYSAKCYATMTLENSNSSVLFLVASSPSINGEALITMHWRSRANSTAAWSAYQDTMSMRYGIRDLRVVTPMFSPMIGHHSPNLPAGSEIEYRIYVQIILGDTALPVAVDPNQTSSVMLMEIHA